MSSDDHAPWDDPESWDDDDLDEFLEAWGEVDRQAASVLREAVPDVFAEAPPEPDLVEAAARLRDRIGGRAWPCGYFVEACGWQQALPGEDAELWQQAASATISPPNDPGTPVDEQSAVIALEHADWLGIVLGLVRRGVGAQCDLENAVRDIEECPEVEDESEDPEGETAVLEMALVTVAPLWQALGILDDGERLTALGRWGLPHALHDAWSSSGAEDEEA